MKTSRTFPALAALALAAACTAAEPTIPAGAGQPRYSTLVGSGYQIPPDSTKAPGDTIQ